VYCAAAHTQGAKKAGLPEEQILAARRFQSPDARRQALLSFVRRVIDTKGFVSDEELSAVRKAGYSDGQIAEVAGYIGLATFSNLFNHLNGTALDFPESPMA
jgi:alkylhydroperoxidase family enzyme